MKSSTSSDQLQRTSCSSFVLNLVFHRKVQSLIMMIMMMMNDVVVVIVVDDDDD